MVHRNLSAFGRCSFIFLPGSTIGSASEPRADSQPSIAATRSDGESLKAEAHLALTLAAARLNRSSSDRCSFRVPDNGLDRFAMPLEIELAPLKSREVQPGGITSGRARQDLAALRERGEARGYVHSVA